MMPANEMPALDVRDLTLTIRDARVVDGVSFSVAPGEVLAIVGESGCGKSLTARAVMGLLPQAVRRVGGTIRLGADDLSGLSESGLRSLRGRRMSMIFQEPQAALDPLATVGTQIAEALRRPLRAVRSDVRRSLDDVGLSDPDRRIDQFPFELSGGMCQRVMIAAALIGGPAVLLADEPTTALDVTIQAQILALLRRLTVERGTAVVLITHDMGVVADIADRVAVMYAGRIVETGDADAVFSHPRHPYTALLLASIPRLDDAPKSRLAVIEGRVPTAAEMPSGCRFVTRCPYADAKCAAEAPPLVGDDEHKAACWHTDRLQ
jgi:peptide/nickel transport system ATP-binding protein